MKNKSNNSIGRPIVIQSSQTSVQGGVVSDISSVLKKLFDTIFKGLDKLIDGLGWEKQEERQVERDGLTWVDRTYKTGSSKKVFVSFAPCDDSGKRCNLVMKAQGCKDFVKSNILISKIDDYVTEYASENELGSNEGQISADASTKVCRITLQRVTSSKGVDSINLMKIQANYPIQLAVEDVQAVVNDDEFVDSLQYDEPQSFEITEVPSEENPDEFEYDVNEIENDIVDGSMSYEELLKAAVRLSFDIQSLCWGAKGPRMEELKSKAYNWTWTVQNAIDMFAQLMVSETHVVPHLGKLATGGTGGVDMSQGFDLEEGLTVLEKSIDKFVNELENHYVNLPHEVQKRVDDMLFELKNGFQNNVKRAMM